MNEIKIGTWASKKKQRKSHIYNLSDILNKEVCCHCKIPFIDESNNLDLAPLCQECRNRSGE